MIFFLCRTLRVSKTLNHRLLSYHSPLLLLPKLSFSSTATTVDLPSSSSVSKISYLTSRCGLSTPAAESALRKLKLNTTHHADSVLALLRSHGFSDLHIAKLVGRSPYVLSSVLNILEEKLEFFGSKGLSGEEIGRMFSSESQLLRTNLEKRIVPNYDLLVDYLGGEDKALMAVVKVPRLLMNNLQTTLLPNVEMLRKHGMKGSNLDILLSIKSRAMFRKKERFEDFVRQLVEMGYDLSTGKHRMALSVIASNSTASWERKVALLKSMGWTMEDILVAFRANPNFIEVSTEKMRRRILFLMNKFNHSKEAIVLHPILLMLSLERRILPRCTVFNVLVSKGFVMMKMHETQTFIISEKDFLKKYVEKYRDIVPEVVDAYEGRVEFAGVEMECYSSPNIEILRKHHVPESSIGKLTRNCPRALLVNCSHFKAVIEGLNQMGFDAKSDKFIDALSALAVISDLTSKAKFGLYRSFGWSDEDIMKAIKKQPNFVSVPDEQFKKIVHVCVDNLGWNPADIAAYPSLLLLDLEKCILPRCSVFKMLVSKGALQRKRPGDVFFSMSDNMFLKKYVKKYQDKVPELLEAYKGHPTFPVLDGS